MTLFASPEIDSETRDLLAEADYLRARIGVTVSSPERWVRELRRQAEAEAYAGSTEIEGFRVGADRVAPVVGGALPESRNEEALACYAHAMRHVGAMATDPRFEWSWRVVLDLHFDACSFQPEKHPGVQREKPVSVTSGDRRTAYSAPDASQLDLLSREFVTWLQASAALHPLVAGAMAHLQLVSLHPFEDGNGRISRIVQSLVLAQRGETVAELGSIEPYLARNTADYYRVLESVQGGSWSPGRDASEWLKFCLRAQVEEAARCELTIAEAGRRWAVLDKLVAARDWPDRLAIALERALVTACDRSGYAAEAGVSNPTATNDLRRLVDAGLLESVGAARSTRYVASEDLRSRIEA
ncbi:MAG: Fic family protein [Solirubrobacterales bacterium]